MVYDLMTDILDQIPKDDKYKNIRYEIECLKSSVSFAAPEIVNNYVYKLHEVLKQNIPITPDSPAWVMQIKTIWDTWNENQKKKDLEI